MGKFKDASDKKDSKQANQESTIQPDGRDFRPDPDAPNPPVTEARASVDAAAPLVVDGIAQDLAPVAEAPRVQKMNRQYRVIGGPSSVMYNGQRMNVTMGKIFIEHAVDLDLLRSQGIRLQLLPEATSVMGNG